MLSKQTIQALQLRSRIAVAPLFGVLPRCYITALSEESEEVTELEVLQLKAFQLYFVSHFYPNESGVIYGRALPFREGHRTVTFLKGSPPRVQRALGWRYRLGNGSDPVYRPLVGRPLTLVQAMDKIRTEPSWGKWKAERPTVFPSSRVVCHVCGRICGLVKRTQGLVLSNHYVDGEKGRDHHLILKKWCQASGTPFQKESL